jgi:hypothetical protein
MKTLLINCLCLASFLPVHAQSAWHSPLPVDSATHRITYTGIVDVPGATKLELYSRAREWYATTFGSSKAVLEMDDKDAGKLIGKAYASFGFAGSIGKPLEWPMWRTIKVEVKDGRYRYTLTDFQLGSPSQPQSSARPLESWLDASTKNGKQPGRVVMSVIDGAKQTGEAEVASLRVAMSKKDSGF